MNPDGRNDGVIRYFFIISQNSFDVGQDFIGRSNHLPGQHFVVCEAKKLECVEQFILGLENSKTPVLGR